jgi:hypothetical protein
MSPSLLVGLAMSLGGVALLIGIALFSSWRMARKEAKRQRERGPHATIAPTPRQEHDRRTDRWNLTP